MYPKTLHFSAFQVLHLQLESTARKHPSLPSLVCELVQHSSKLSSVMRHPIRGASLSGANPLGLNTRSQSYPNDLALSSASTSILATVEREGHLSGKPFPVLMWLQRGDYDVTLSARSCLRTGQSICGKLPRELICRHRFHEACSLARPHLHVVQ